jgi:hypothetical protein
MRIDAERLAGAMAERPRSKGHRVQLSLLKFRLQAGEGNPGVGHALFDGRLHLGRELAGVKSLARADADLDEARHEFLLGGDRRAELQHEVQDVEELRRGLLFCGRKRLDEINSRCRFGRRLAEKRGERLHFIANLDLLHSQSDAINPTRTSKPIRAS